MFPRQITHRNIFRVLLAGFSLVILLLLAAATVGVRSIQSIQQNAANLVREQSVTNRLIDELLGLFGGRTQPVMAHLARRMNPGTHAKVPDQDFVGHAQEALRRSLGVLDGTAVQLAHQRPDLRQAYAGRQPPGRDEL